MGRSRIQLQVSIPRILNDYLEADAVRHELSRSQMMTKLLAEKYGCIVEDMLEGTRKVKPLIIETLNTQAMVDPKSEEIPKDFVDLYNNPARTVEVYTTLMYGKHWGNGTPIGTKFEMKDVNGEAVVAREYYDEDYYNSQMKSIETLRRKGEIKRG